MYRNCETRLFTNKLQKKSTLARFDRQRTIISSKTELIEQIAYIYKCIQLNDSC